MQVLKDEIKKAIDSAAIHEFYRLGYIDTSIRGVAKRAGISVGNLYHYYKSKDELFYDLLAPVVSEIVSIISENELDEYSGKVSELQFHMEIQIGRITGVILKRRMEISILLYGSKGTKYENVKDIFIKSLFEHIKEHIDLNQIKFPEEMAWIMAVSIVEGYLEIVRKYYDHPMFMEFLNMYFKLHFKGWLDFFTVGK